MVLGVNCPSVLHSQGVHDLQCCDDTLLRLIGCLIHGPREEGVGLVRIRGTVDVDNRGLGSWMRPRGSTIATVRAHQR